MFDIPLSSGIVSLRFAMKNNNLLRATLAFGAPCAKEGSFKEWYYSNDQEYPVIMGVEDAMEDAMKEWMDQVKAERDNPSRPGKNRSTSSEGKNPSNID